MLYVWYKFVTFEWTMLSQALYKFSVIQVHKNYTNSKMNSGSFI